MSIWEPLSQSSLTPSQIHDLRLTASEMALKYCRSSAQLLKPSWAGAVRPSHPDHFTEMEHYDSPSFPNVTWYLFVTKSP